ncbi:MAG: hypothetical protein IJT24_01315 [Lachnospiraceae bacterium]|nr:hypothetical protein [Lachnospiraceae bacterium]
MDKDKLLLKRHEALEGLEASLQEELIAARLEAPDEEKGVEVLTVIFPELGLDGDGAVGELFFLPLRSDEDSVQHFSTVITIADTIGEECLNELYEAVSFINFRLPCGCYAFDRESGLLAYRLTVPLSVELSPEELLRDMNICSGNAVAAADLHMDLLLRVIDGEASMEDVRAAFALP